jgi:hypothetical protein
MYGVGLRHLIPPEKNIPIEKLRDSSGKTPIEAATKILQDYTNLILQNIYSS